MQRLFKILLVLAVQRGHNWNPVQLGVKQPSRSHGERRMDMDHVNAATDYLCLKQRIQSRRRKVVIIADDGHGMASYHLVR